MTAPNVAGGVQNTSMGRDGDGVVIQAPTRFQCEDATGTTIKSPKTVADTEIDLLVPPNAVTLILTASGADVRVAITDGGTAAAPYYVLQDGKTEPFSVGNMSAVYLLRNAAVSATVYFRFEMIG